jgi:hypothetical protein
VASTATTTACQYPQCISLSPITLAFFFIHHTDWTGRISQDGCPYKTKWRQLPAGLSLSSYPLPPDKKRKYGESPPSQFMGMEGYFFQRVVVNVLKKKKALSKLKVLVDKAHPRIEVFFFLSSFQLCWEDTLPTLSLGVFLDPTSCYR